MFEDLQPAPADKILALIGLYRADPRPDKVDLGVGVYKDRNGKTGQRAVRRPKSACCRAGHQDYLGLAGDVGFMPMAACFLGPT